MATPEKAIVNKVMAEAKRLGWWVLNVHGGPYQMAGLPDLLVIKSGRAAWMEVKVPGKDPTRLQRHKIRELIEVAGCPATVVYSVGDAKEFLGSVE